LSGDNQSMLLQPYAPAHPQLYGDRAAVLSVAWSQAQLAFDGVAISQGDAKYGTVE
jgi:hypothetical protein